MPRYHLELTLRDPGPWEGKLVPKAKVVRTLIDAENDAEALAHSDWSAWRAPHDGVQQKDKAYAKGRGLES